jgi:hypothetical protein
MRRGRTDAQCGSKWTTGFAVTAAVVFATGPSRALDSPCRPDFNMNGVTPDWATALDALRGELARGGDVDSCAQIRVTRAERGARVTVKIADGRIAERFVESPADLRAAIIALLLLPPPPPKTPSAEVSASPELIREEHPPGSDIAPTRLPGVAEVDRTLSPSPSSPRPTERFDLALATGGRWSGDHPGISVGGFAEVSLGRWAVDVNGRWDDYAGPSGSPDAVGYTVRSLEIGAAIGRHFDVGPFALTASFGPSVVAEWQKLNSTPPPVYVAFTNPKTGAVVGDLVPSGRDARVARLGGGVRGTLLSSTRLSLFLSLDASIDVMTDAANQIPTLYAGTAPLPTWSGGVSLGGQLRLWP